MNKPIDTKNTEAQTQTLPRYEAPRIQAMSEGPGTGATFVIRLPRSDR